MINDKYLYGWIFGSIFLKKYQLIFNQDSKTIGYYKSMNNYIDNYDNNNKIPKKIGILKSIVLGLLLMISSFLLILFGMIIQKKIFNKNKKINANELEESFTYKPEKNNENLYEETKNAKYNNI